MSEQIQTKWCNYGQHYVPFFGFTKRRKEKDGLDSRCRECRHQTHRKKNPPHPNRIAPKGMKWCNAGKHYQPRTGFAKCSANVDGLKYHCKECVNKKKVAHNAARRALLGPVQVWNKRPRAEKLCEGCGEIYSPPHSRANSSRYCSKKCRRNRTEHVCAHCGKKYEVRASESERTRYCSKACFVSLQGERTHTNKIGFKKCSSCQTEKHRDYFYKDSRQKDGLMDKCKSCFKILLHKRRGQIKGAKGSYTTKEWLAKCEYHGWQCLYCRAELTPHTATVEHRIPINKSGANFISNIAPACRKCNSQKHDKSEKEFRDWLDRLAA